MYMHMFGTNSSKHRESRNFQKTYSILNIVNLVTPKDNLLQTRQSKSNNNLKKTNSSILNLERMTTLSHKIQGCKSYQPKLKSPAHCPKQPALAKRKTRQISGPETYVQIIKLDRAVSFYLNKPNKHLICCHV